MFLLTPRICRIVLAVAAVPALAVGLWIVREAKGVQPGDCLDTPVTYNGSQCFNMQVCSPADCDDLDPPLECDGWPYYGVLFSQTQAWGECRTVSGWPNPCKECKRVCGVGHMAITCADPDDECPMIRFALDSCQQGGQ